MSEAETELLRVLRERSFKTGGTFELASGGTSDYYIDGKMCEVFSEGAYLIGEVLYERTKGLGLQAIGGLEAGAIPLTTAAVISYRHRGEKMEGFWVRDKAKGHGTRKLVEGNLQKGSRVVILDDVVTRGISAVQAIDAVRAMECDIVQVISLVDRASGARELFREHGITEYRPVFTVRDLMESDSRDANVRRTPEVLAR